MKIRHRASGNVYDIYDGAVIIFRRIGRVTRESRRDWRTLGQSFRTLRDAKAALLEAKNQADLKQQEIMRLREQRAIHIAKSAMGIKGDDFAVVFSRATTLNAPYTKDGWRGFLQEKIVMDLYKYDGDQRAYFGCGEITKILAIHLPIDLEANAPTN